MSRSWTGPPGSRWSCARSTRSSSPSGGASASSSTAHPCSSRSASRTRGRTSWRRGCPLCWTATSRSDQAAPWCSSRRARGPSTRTWTRSCSGRTCWRTPSTRPSPSFSTAYAHPRATAEWWTSARSFYCRTMWKVPPRRSCRCSPRCTGVSAPRMDRTSPWRSSAPQTRMRAWGRSRAMTPLSGQPPFKKPPRSHGRYTALRGSWSRMPTRRPRC
mmetsp:Transcript_15381/g.40736  ORF Transcript_15381/g.40736 Transcript_15381/m.40736 type:complete len:216 (+) Transcript_15381:264-911(+)